MSVENIIRVEMGAGGLAGKLLLSFLTGLFGTVLGLIDISLPTPPNRLKSYGCSLTLIVLPPEHFI